MKTTWLSLLLLISSFTYAQLPSNLKAYFTFNGTLNDTTGQSSPALNNGGTATTDRFAINNHAYSFDGSGDYIDLSADLNYGTTTIAFWFKPNDAVLTQAQIMLSNLAN